MEEILKIVEGFIPEDQKADIKAKIDGTLDTFAKEKAKETKRELSSKFGVNFFEEDVEKAFNNEKFIKREVLLQKENEFNEKLNELEALRKENQTFKEEREFNDVSVKLISKGLKPERLDVVKPLLDKEGTIEERIEKLMTKVPEFFVKQEQEVKKVVIQTTEPNESQKSKLTDFEKYLKSKKQ